MAVDYITDNVDPLDIDPTTFRATNEKFFTIGGEPMMYEEWLAIPSNKDKLMELSELMAKKGMIYRVSANANTDYHEVVSKFFKYTMIGYKAFGKYVIPDNVINIAITAPISLAYQYVASLFGKREDKLSRFNNYTGGMRMVQALKSHIVLGETLQEPISLLLYISKGGAQTVDEVKKDGLEGWKNLGNDSMLFRITDSLDIPIFNLKNDSAFEDAKNYIDKL